MKKDYRNTPVTRFVVMGESNAFGMCASDSRNEWVQTLANLIKDFQDKPLTVINSSIPANVISPQSPGYSTIPDWGKPSAIERYKSDLIDQAPDIAVLAYGLNDSRCGYETKLFLNDLEKIVADTVAMTDALVVLAGPYWNTQYNEKLWNRLKKKPEWATGEYSIFAQTGRDLVWSYLKGIEKLTCKYGCLFADLFTPTENCTWLLHDNQCHYNDIGHRVLGQILFNVIACNCSFTGKKSVRILREGGFDTTNTGGTRGMSRMTRDWLGR